MEAEEFIIRNCIETLDLVGVNQQYCIEEIKKAMIEFAKYHVSQSLLAAVEKGKTTYERDGIAHIIGIDKESILNSYPTENIK